MTKILQRLLRRPEKTLTGSVQVGDKHYDYRECSHQDDGFGPASAAGQTAIIADPEHAQDRYS